MNDIYLPELKSINIKNFSLYPKGLDFTYNFIDGVNLIVGGNGIGKTTFINLIKYGLIGLYRKHKDSRRYKETKIIKRTQFSADYFYNRMDKSFLKNYDAKVILSFSIHDTFIEVTRNLYDVALEKVKVIEGGLEYFIDGKIISQFKYEKLSSDQKVEFLQYKYEEKVAKLTNVYDFDDFIFFINEVLLFGENRKTILWDIELQEILSSKYFNDPEYDNKYTNLKIDAKYNDSLSRHVSEDIRAIKGVLTRVQDKNPSPDNKASIANGINDLKHRIDKGFTGIESIQTERKMLEGKLNVKLNEKQNIEKKILESENYIKAEEKMLYSELWEKLNPQYHIFLKYIKNNSSCPMCNKEIDISLLNKILKDESKCMLCNSDIKNKEDESEKVKIFKIKLEELLVNKQSTESEIFNAENELIGLDGDFAKLKLRISTSQSKLRDLEYSLNSSESNDNESITINKMMDEIYLLEVKKKDLQDKSKYYLEEASKISNFMDESRVKITRTLSSIFSDFAEKFLSLKCELTYDDIDGYGKRYIPKIDGSLRTYSDELSESQCFFIDHSFRMSLLNYFYRAPSFFICETPESSLDISYEINAANIFLKYLNKSNALILTSNLNNSKFLDHIIENAPAISYINLLKIGRPSSIQSVSTSLIKVSERIEEKINAKRKHK